MADGAESLRLYPRSSAPEDTILGHLRFAVRYEAFDLGLLVGALKVIDPRMLEGWVRREPTGSHSRRLWFLYETFTGDRLDLANARAGKYVPVVDPKKFVVGAERRSVRHRVADNLIGDATLCPIVRRTPRLIKLMAAVPEAALRRLRESVDAEIWDRCRAALSDLEARAILDMAAGSVNPARAKRLAGALGCIAEVDLEDMATLRLLQGDLVDPACAAVGWRSSGGAAPAPARSEAVTPEPVPPCAAVPGLMEAWVALARRLFDGKLEAGVAAALSGLMLRLIHPFDHGNGPLHRVVILHALARRGMGGAGMILPVSAVMARDRDGEATALAAVAGQIGQTAGWAEHHRYVDATAFAEYVYDRVLATMLEDVPEQLRLAALVGRIQAALNGTVALPDRRAARFVRHCLDNGGRFPAAERRHFAELSDAEIAAMEAALALPEAEPSCPETQSPQCKM